jgi:SAM-dependent methyltransferase
MSYLLRRLGLNVVATDIRKETPFFVKHYNDHFHDDHIAYHWYNILDSESINSLNGMKFDAICMSGVLEHVSDFSMFLKCLRPLLVKNGKLFIFRFPNRYSWIEKINEYRFDTKIDHPLRFTRREVDFMLRWHGFRVDTAAFEEIFPVNLNGFPEPLIKMYHGSNMILMPISKLLCKTPLINQLSTSYRFICTKAYDY